MKNTGTRRRRSHGTQATLADVARVAAVSTASASRALARPASVSDELWTRVAEAAETLRYVPNSAARALVRRRSGLIGVVIGGLEEPGTATALAELEARLTDAGWAQLLAAGGKKLAPVDAARTLLGHGVEALVFIGAAIPADLATMRGIEHLPCVSVDRPDAAGFAAHAGLDLVRVGKLVAEYLRQLGHRHLAVVVESDSSIGNLLIDALRADLGPAPLEILRLGDGPLSDGLLRWFALADSPTAAICGSDAIAVALIHACACNGIDVPGRMSVIGFGDSALARCVTPMLTSIRIPAQSAGAAAAEYLLAHFAGRASDPNPLPIKLAIRASTGPPQTGVAQA